MAIRPGISCSASRIWVRPNSASDRSETANSRLFRFCSFIVTPSYFARAELPGAPRCARVALEVKVTRRPAITDLHETRAPPFPEAPLCRRRCQAERGGNDSVAAPLGSDREVNNGGRMVSTVGCLRPVLRVQWTLEERLQHHDRVRAAHPVDLVNPLQRGLQVAGVGGAHLDQ